MSWKAFASRHLGDGRHRRCLMLKSFILPQDEDINSFLCKASRLNLTPISLSLSFKRMHSMLHVHSCMAGDVIHATTHRPTSNNLHYKTLSSLSEIRDKACWLRFCVFSSRMAARASPPPPRYSHRIHHLVRR